MDILIVGIVRGLGVSHALHSRHEFTTSGINLRILSGTPADLSVVVMAVTVACHHLK